MGLDKNGKPLLMPPNKANGALVVPAGGRLEGKRARVQTDAVTASVSFDQGHAYSQQQLSNVSLAVPEGCRSVLAASIPFDTVVITIPKGATHIKLARPELIYRRTTAYSKTLDGQKSVEAAAKANKTLDTSRESIDFIPEGALWTLYRR
jgi:hypothetical protein